MSSSIGGFKGSFSSLDLEQEVSDGTDSIEFFDRDEKVGPQLGEIPRLQALCAANLVRKKIPIINSVAFRMIYLKKVDERGETVLDENNETIFESRIVERGIPGYGIDKEKYVQDFQDHFVKNYDDGSKNPCSAFLVDKESYLAKQAAASNIAKSSPSSFLPSNPLASLTRAVASVRSIWANNKKFQSIETLRGLNEDTLIDFMNIGFSEENLKKDPETLSLLFRIAVRDQKNKVVEQLLSEFPMEIDVNSTDSNGMSALMYAISNQDTQLIEKLIRAEVDPDQVYSVKTDHLMKILLSKIKPLINGFLPSILQFFTKQCVRDQNDKICESLDDKSILENLEENKDKIQKIFNLTPEELLLLVKSKVKENNISFEALEKLIPFFIERLIERIPSGIGSSKMTPVVMAAILGNDEVVLSLITAKTSMQEIHKVVLIAAALGHTNIIMALIEKKSIDINSQEFFAGVTPLMLATLTQRNETVKYLLEKGDKADLYLNFNELRDIEFNDLIPNLPLGAPRITLDVILTKLGITGIKEIKLSPATIALTLAPAVGNFELIDIFAKHGVDYSALDNENELKVLALFLGSLSLIDNPKNLDFLLEQGIDINTPASRLYGPTAFFLFNLCIMSRSGKGKIKEIGGTLLTGMLEIISQKDVDETLKDNFLEVITLILIMNAKNLNPTIVKEEIKKQTDMLLMRGSNIDCQDTMYGKTPLMLSLKFSPFSDELDGIDGTQELLDKGADPNVRNNQGKTSLHLLAEEYIDDELRREAMKLLLKHGANPDIQDHNGKTPLMNRVNNKYHGTESVNILLGAGADPDINDFTGNTSLHHAVEVGSDEAFELILNNKDKSVDITVTNAVGETALAIARRRGDFNKIKMLLEKGEESNIGRSLAFERVKYPVRRINIAVKNSINNFQNQCRRHPRKMVLFGVLNLLNVSLLAYLVSIMNKVSIMNIVNSYLGGNSTLDEE